MEVRWSPGIYFAHASCFQQLSIIQSFSYSLFEAKSVYSLRAMVHCTTWVPQCLCNQSCELEHGYQSITWLYFFYENDEKDNIIVFKTKNWGLVRIVPGPLLDLSERVCRMSMSMSVEQAGDHAFFASSTISIRFPMLPMSLAFSERTPSVAPTV
jgi:hypothetical protein